MTNPDTGSEPAPMRGPTRALVGDSIYPTHQRWIECESAEAAGQWDDRNWR